MLFAESQTLFFERDFRNVQELQEWQHAEAR